MKIKFNTEMELIKEFFKDFTPVYFVGGCIRDIIMGNTPKDYDLFTPHTPDEITKYIKSKGRRVWKQGARFGTLGVKLNGMMVEITTFRTETYTKANRKPEVEYTTNVTEDINRRDFTINSMYVDMNGRLYNPHNGKEDIIKGIIKCVGSPKRRFKEDPLRILRAIRFSAKYNFIIEEKTLKALHDGRLYLLTLSKERIVDELNKILLLDVEGVGNGLELLWKCKIFQVIIPELQLQYEYEQNSKYHNYKLHTHTIKVVQAVRGSLKDSTPEDKQQETFVCMYLWSALLHDVAKPFVRTLHKSGEYCNYIGHEVLGAEIAERYMLHYKFSNFNKRNIVTTIKEHLKEECWLRKYDHMGKIDKEGK